jgi:hypothetical protein
MSYSTLTRWGCRLQLGIWNGICEVLSCESINFVMENLQTGSTARRHYFASYDDCTEGAGVTRP